MDLQGELFAAPPLVPGLGFFREAVSGQDEAGIVRRIDAAPLQPFQFGQWQGKRLTVSYGSAYDFTRGTVTEAPPLPDWLVDLRNRLATEAGMEPAALQQALLIRYGPGAGIGWHRDRPQYGEVLGLSLGAPAKLRLRRRTETGFERRNVELEPRSLYRLSGEVRRDWEHSITPMEAVRWSVTFRTLRAGA